MIYEVSADVIYGGKRERKALEVEAKTGDQAAAAGHALMVQEQQSDRSIRSFKIVGVTPSQNQPIETPENDEGVEEIDDSEDEEAEGEEGPVIKQMRRERKARRRGRSRA